jgi:Mg2+ and Co2+ transporter CorA
MSLELLATENNIKVNSYANPDQWPTLKHHIRDVGQIKVKHSKIQKQRVACQTFHIFLLNDSTVITFFPVDGSLLYKPILNQLRHKDTLLRNSQDASLLIQAIMDVTIDLTAEVVDSYAHQIAQLEELVMSSPRMTYTKVLHLLKGEINNFKQRYSALYGVVNSLIAFEPLDNQPEISKKAKVYLTDVLEHSNTIMGEVETLIESAESLIDLIFNLISYDTNESMKYLAIVSCIFLPVTFVAGGKAYIINHLYIYL